MRLIISNGLTAMKAVSRVKRVLPWIVALALFLETLDSTIIATAVPKIAESLQVNPLDLKLALTSYLLSIAIFIPISSWIAERYGTRAVFTSAMAIFTLGSICCGFAFNLTTLVLARILQGIGGALMTPVARMVLVRVFNKAELLKVISFVTIPALVGPLLGPVVGGTITTLLSWRWIFFVNIPFSFYGLYFSYRYFINIYGRRRVKLDKLGWLLFTLASVGFTFSFEMLEEPHMPVSVKLFSVGVGLIGLLAFWLHARKPTQTLFNLKLFAIDTFKIAFIGNCWTRLGLGGLTFILPLFFQLGFGFTPMHAGLLMAPLALGLISMKLFVKQALQRCGFRKILLVNTVLLTLIISAFCLIDKTTPQWLIVLLLFINGSISSLQYSSMNTLVLADIPPKLSNQASMILSTGQQLGSSFGVGVCALLLGFFLSAEHLQHSTQLIAYHKVFMVMASMILMANFAFWRLAAEAGQDVSRYKQNTVVTD